MTHAEQEETAQLIRGLMGYQIENARLKGVIGQAIAHLERGTALDVMTAIRLLK
jgi:GAF domain-containing protein